MLFGNLPRRWSATHTGAVACVMGRRWARTFLLAMPLFVAPVFAEETDEYPTIPVESTDPAIQLDPLLVTGDSATLPRYVSDRGDSATKMEVPLVETPQSISVITLERMRDLGATSLQEALRYTAGVRADAYGLDSRSDSAVIRGTDFIQYQDGLRALFGSFNNTRPDPYALQSVEVIRGPASVLYGQGSSGGTVNLTSKRPLAEFAHELVLQSGSHDRKQVAIDTTGPLISSGSLLYRLVAMTRESETQVDFVRDDRWFVAPSLSWSPTEWLQWTVLGHFQRDESGSTTAFLPWEGVVLPNPNGWIPTERFVSEPDFDRYYTEQSAVTSILDVEIGDILRFRQNLRYLDSGADYRSLFPNIYTGDPYQFDPLQRRRVLRVAFTSDVETQAITADQQLLAQWRWGPIEQQVLAGFDTTRVRINDVRAQSSVLQILAQGRFDLYDPVYGRFIVPTAAAQPELIVRQNGWYLQDQIRFGQHWIALLGMRRDSASSQTAGSTTIDDSETSLRAGLLYHRNSWAPYVSYSESFLPVTSLDADGNPFKPVRGRQLEGGIKYQPDGGQSLVTLAAFEIEEKNRLAPGDTPFVQKQLGLATIRGIEVEALTHWRETLDLMLNFTWLDAWSDDGEQAGDARIKFLASTPERFGGVWLRWHFALFGQPGFSLGAGARYTAAIPDQTGTVEAPANTLFDAMAAFETEHWRFAINGTNLEDERVVAACIERGDCFYGSRRNVVGTLSYRF